MRIVLFLTCVSIDAEEGIPTRNQSIPQNV